MTRYDELLIMAYEYFANDVNSRYLEHDICDFDRNIYLACQYPVYFIRQARNNKTCVRSHILNVQQERHCIHLKVLFFNHLQKKLKTCQHPRFQFAVVAVFIRIK